jgi:hypothetical protein
MSDEAQTLYHSERAAGGVRLGSLKSHPIVLRRIGGF